MLVETFNNEPCAMATVNFSVPDEVRNDFNRAFKGQNKSAIIADLMRRAVAESRRRKQREAHFAALTARRRERPAARDRDIAAARTRGRP
jgi:metal-responsive CopG/Arc/MetJ family transcriptional regulator